MSKKGGKLILNIGLGVTLFSWDPLKKSKNPGQNEEDSGFGVCAVCEVCSLHKYAGIDLTGWCNKTPPPPIFESVGCWLIGFFNLFGPNVVILDSFGWALGSGLVTTAGTELGAKLSQTSTEYSVFLRESVKNIFELKVIQLVTQELSL